MARPMLSPGTKRHSHLPKRAPHSRTKYAPWGTPSVGRTGGTMKKSGRIIHRIGNRPRGVRAVRPHGDHRLRDTVDADLDPLHGHPAVQDGAPELRHVPPDGEGTQLQRRVFRHPRRRQPRAPVQRRADRRRPAVREDQGGGRLRPALRRGEHPGRPGQVSLLRQLQDRDAGGQHLDPRRGGRNVRHRDEERGCQQRRLHEDRHEREHLLRPRRQDPPRRGAVLRRATTA